MAKAVYLTLDLSCSNGKRRHFVPSKTCSISYYGDKGDFRPGGPKCGTIFCNKPLQKSTYGRLLKKAELQCLLQQLGSGFLCLHKQTKTFHLTPRVQIQHWWNSWEAEENILAMPKAYKRSDNNNILLKREVLRGQECNHAHSFPYLFLKEPSIRYISQAESGLFTNSVLKWKIALSVFGDIRKQNTCGFISLTYSLTFIQSHCILTYPSISGTSFCWDRKRVQEHTNESCCRGFT